MAFATIRKSPYAQLAYSIDWTPWLNGADTISAVVWVVPAGITKVTQSETTVKATIQLSGGTAGMVYDVVCKMDTVGGLKDQRTLRFMVEER